MARLPTIGETNWGSILNEFLNQSHNTDGSLKGVLNVTNVKDYGAKGDGVTDDTAAINNALNVAAASKPDFPNPLSRIIYFPSGKYMVSQIVIPDQSGYELILQGNYIGSQIVQIDNNGGKDMIITEAGFATQNNQQFNAGLSNHTFRDLTFIGHYLGGNCLHINNIGGLQIERCKIIGAGNQSALLRLRRVIKATINILSLSGAKFYSSSQTKDNCAKHGIWIGDAIDNGDNTNLWFSNIFAENLQTNRGFPNGHAIFIDGTDDAEGEANRTGGTTFQNMKWDGIECPEAAVKILDASNITFINSGFEFRTGFIGAGGTGANTSSYHIENSSLIYGDRSSAGHPSKNGVALNIINSHTIEWSNCTLRGYVTGTITGAIRINGTSDHIILNNCNFSENIIIKENDVVKTNLELYPKLIISNCREINNNSIPPSSNDPLKGLVAKYNNVPYIIKSPNGTRYKLSVDNSGNLSAQPVT